MKQALSLICLVFVLQINAQLPIVNGWTQFTPSSDSRIIYVSSTGNDATAQFYSPSSPVIGSNPFLPGGNVQAYQTITAAISQLRNGSPDWILFKNGDTFTNQNFGILTLSGRNKNEPMLFGSYGSSTSRPRILTGNQTAISIGYYVNPGTCNYLAFVGLSFEPHTRSGTDTPTGIQIYADFNSILLEDCLFEKYSGHITILDPSGGTAASRTGFSVRRSILIDAYTTGANHAGAMFIQNVDSILFEENLLDHNGWSTTISGANPTPFRHNSYFQVGNQHLVFKNNIVSRAAATGGGHRCGGYIYDNLYLSNPQNLQFGTHETTLNWPTEYVEGEVAYNVVLDSRVESFDDGRGIRVQRAKNTNVHHNIVAHFTPVSDYNLGIFINETDNVRVSNNIVYKWGNNTTSGFVYSSGINAGAGLMGNNFIDSNDVQMENTKGYCMDINANQNNINFSYNRYYNVTPANEWFQPGGNFASWSTFTGEVGAQQVNVPYIDPERNITTYLATLSVTGNLNDFLNLRRAMSKSNWNNNYTANTVNNYIRYGFNVAPISTGIQENTLNELNLYPNPASTVLVINGNKKINAYIIYNSLGQQIKSEQALDITNHSIDINDYKSGIYFIFVTYTDKSTSIKKWIKR